NNQFVPGQIRPGGFGGFGGGGAAFQFGGGQGLGANQQQAQTVGQFVVFPVPRLNSILLGVPKSRREDILKEIKRLDQDTNPQMVPKKYQLKRASAQIVAAQIQNFFNQRYPNQPLNLDQTRVFFDASSNTVMVQAAPADQKDIAELIAF